MSHEPVSPGASSPEGAPGHKPNCICVVCEDSRAALRGSRVPAEPADFWLLETDMVSYGFQAFRGDKKDIAFRAHRMYFDAGDKSATIRPLFLGAARVPPEPTPPTQTMRELRALAEEFDKAAHDGPAFFATPEQVKRWQGYAATIYNALAALDAFRSEAMAEDARLRSGSATPPEPPPTTLDTSAIDPEALPSSDPQCVRCGGPMFQAAHGAYRGLWACADFCGQFGVRIERCHGDGCQIDVEESTGECVHARLSNKSAGSATTTPEPDGEDSLITTDVRECGGLLLHVTDADNICAERGGLYGLGATVEEALANLRERPHTSTPATPSLTTELRHRLVAWIGSGKNASGHFPRGLVELNDALREFGGLPSSSPAESPK